MVVRGSGSYIRAVALALGDDSLLAAWTDAGGTMVQPLDLEGNSRGRPRKVGPSAESLDLVALSDGYALSILVQGDLIWGGGGAFLQLLDDRGEPTGGPLELGRAGVFSKGIAVAKVNSTPLVVWQDGVPGSLVVKAKTEGLPTTILSDIERNGCCPHVVADGDGFITAWGEFVVNRSVAKIMVRRFGKDGVPLAESSEVLETRVQEPWPALTVLNDGFGMIYRDRTSQRSLENLFFARFDDENRPIIEPSHLGRYDGPTRGVLLTAGEILMAFEVRSWSRERIIGFDRFDGQGTRIGAQAHLFFDHLRLTDVDGLRQGTRYVVLYAEDQPRQAVWLTELRCR